MTLNTQMTPRAWRMLSYCAAAFAIYGLLIVAEFLQTLHLRRIDQELRDKKRMAYDVENIP